MEEFGEKIKNPCFENFFGVTGISLVLREYEESNWIMEVYNSKY